jgi:hypothetical protein
MMVCEKCGEEIEPADAVEYIAQLPVLSPDPGRPAKLDGRSAFFHRDHVPRANPNWRPASDDDPNESESEADEEHS